MKKRLFAIIIALMLAVTAIGAQGEFDGIVSVSETQLDMPVMEAEDVELVNEEEQSIVPVDVPSEEDETEQDITYDETDGIDIDVNECTGELECDDEIIEQPESENDEMPVVEEVSAEGMNMAEASVSEEESVEDELTEEAGDSIQAETETIVANIEEIISDDAESGEQLIPEMEESNTEEETDSEKICETEESEETENTDNEEAEETAEEELKEPVDEKVISARWINAAAGLRGSLSGNWRNDILMVARSQVGYTENAEDIIIDENGEEHGRSLYGAIFGKPYQEWSAMFVSFCIKYARIDYTLFPTASLSNVLAGNIGYYGAYENDEDKYMPKPGDFVFFNSTGSGVSAERVGIVESAGNESVTVIEGDVGNSVCRRTYLRSDETIIGYGNIDKYMSVSLEKNAVEVAEEAAETEQPAEEVIIEEEAAEELTEEEPIEEEPVEEELTEEEPVEEELIEEEPVEEELTEEEPIEEEPIEEELTEEETVEEEPSEESVEFDPYKEELKLWAEEVSATEEMIERAEKAKSLDSIVYENGYFVYVRTGIALARFDRVDGIVYDIATRLPVAIYDEEAGIIYPLFDDEYAESENNVVSDEEIKYTENCQEEV